MRALCARGGQQEMALCDAEPFAVLAAALAREVLDAVLRLAGPLLTAGAPDLAAPPSVLDPPTAPRPLTRLIYQKMRNMFPLGPGWTGGAHSAGGLADRPRIGVVRAVPALQHPAGVRATLNSATKEGCRMSEEPQQEVEELVVVATGENLVCSFAA